MAKKTKKSFHGTGRWKSVPDDAIRLAALRWFALTIEQSAIELYATNTASYKEMVLLLRKTVKEIGELRDRFEEDDDDCPEGYILCKNGLCQPSCDFIPGDSDNS